MKYVVKFEIDVEVEAENEDEAVELALDELNSPLVDEADAVRVEEKR